MMHNARSSVLRVLKLGSTAEGHTCREPYLRLGHGHATLQYMPSTWPRRTADFLQTNLLEFAGNRAK
jgi:hypothetical protein